MKTLRIRNWAGAAVAARLSAAAAGALLVCAAVSCKKEVGSEPAQAYGVRAFQATSEGHSGDGKTTLAGNIVKWEGGDAVAVQGIGDAAPVKFTTEDHGVVSANFECGAGESVSGGEYYAIYPYSAAKGGVDKGSNAWSVTLPKYQVTANTGTFASGANLMAAQSNDEGTFTFRNMCGVLRLKLKGMDGMSLRFIRVESRNESENLWGTSRVVFGGIGGTHSLEPPTEGDGSVYLVYPHGVGIGGYAEFDIVLPAGSLKKGFKAEVHCEYSGHKGVFTMTASNATGAEAMIQRNQITEMEERAFTFDEMAEEDGALPGVFSVNANGKKVRFSKGNLQCRKVNKDNAWSTENIKWVFAENQYEIVEGSEFSTLQADYVDRDAIGLFGWGTTGYNHRYLNVTAPPEDDYCYKPWNTTTSLSYGPLYVEGDEASNLSVSGKSDWGCLNIANGGGKEWRLFNNEELDYVLNKRNIFNNKGYTYNGNGIYIDGALYKGVFIYPDDYTGKVVGNNSLSWNEIDAYGIVYLPCAGYRGKDCVLTHIYNFGGYCSSTAAEDEGHVYTLDFTSNTLKAGNNRERSNGLSVRLVCD